MSEMTRLGWMVAVSALTLIGACGDDEDTGASSPSGPGAGTGASGGETAGNPTSGGNGQGGNGVGGNAQGGSGASGGAGPYQVCNDPPVGYPAGPYGFNLGDVFEPLELAGWTNPNPTQRIDNETFGAYTMDDMRTQHPSTFVMLHLSGMF